MVKNTNSPAKNKPQAEKSNTKVAVAKPKRQKNPAKKSSPSKTSPVKSQNVFSKSFNYLVNNKIMAILVLFILGMTIWLISTRVIIAYEQNQFNKVEAAMDEFTTQIQPILGEDVEIIKNKSCGYRSTKYVSPGNPTCGIGYRANVPVSSAAQANEYAKDIQTALAGNFEVKSQRIGKFVDGANSNGMNNYGLSFAVYGLNCSFRIDYSDPGDITNNYLEDHELELAYTCVNPNSHKVYFNVDD